MTGERIGLRNGVRLGNVFNKCDSSHVLLLFIDRLIVGIVKYVGNFVNNLCFKVNSNSISLVHLIFPRTPSADTEVIVVNVLISQILIFFLIYHEVMPWGKSNRSVNKIDDCGMLSFP